MILLTRSDLNTVFQYFPVDKNRFEWLTPRKVQLVYARCEYIRLFSFAYDVSLSISLIAIFTSKHTFNTFKYYLESCVAFSLLLKRMKNHL